MHGKKKKLSSPSAAIGFFFSLLDMVTVNYSIRLYRLTWITIRPCILLGAVVDLWVTIRVFPRTNASNYMQSKQRYN